MYSMIGDTIDGGILTFESTHPKWSYARLDDAGFVSEVAEKNPISTHATTGHYYWNNWGTFKKSAYTMIDKNIRVNGEFYLCPVFNQTIEDGGIIKKIDMDEVLEIAKLLQLSLKDNFKNENILLLGLKSGWLLLLLTNVTHILQVLLVLRWQVRLQRDCLT